jgi:hypothetical protein
MGSESRRSSVAAPIRRASAGLLADAGRHADRQPFNLKAFQIEHLARAADDLELVECPCEIFTLSPPLP